MGKIHRLIHPRSRHVVLVSHGRMRYEHREVWELHNGPIPEGMIVHHLNHDPQDNRIENLALMTHAEHSRQHQTESNSFKGKRHSELFKAARSKKYRGAGNPRYLKNVSTAEIGLMRGLGFTWSAIGRELGIDRKAAKKRLAAGG